jgi:hypothetical protein
MKEVNKQMVYFNPKTKGVLNTTLSTFHFLPLPKASISFIRRDKNRLFTTCMSYEEV